MGIHFVRRAIGGTCMAGVCLLLCGLTTTAFGGEGERAQTAAYYFPNRGTANPRFPPGATKTKTSRP